MNITGTTTGTDNPVRVLLVDDHKMVRQGLVFFLSTRPDITVVGEAATGEEALVLIDQHLPDVVLLDLVLPQMDGISVIQAVRAKHPDIDIIVLSSFIDQGKVKSAIESGAAGYLLKDVDPAQLADAIRATRRGEIYLHPEAARRLAEALRPEAHEREEPPQVLSERELEVLKLVAHGMSNQQISEALNITLKTVKAHVSSILQKLSLESRVQAALYALRHRIATLEKS